MSIDPAYAARVGASQDLVARAEQLHRQSIVVDGSSVVYEKSSTMPTRWDRYTRGGVTATNHTVTMPGVGFRGALAEVNASRRWIEANSDKVTLIETVADIERAHRDQLGGVIFGPQDTAFLEQDLDNVALFHDLGLRILQLTYQMRNFIGDGCGEVNPGTLSRFGIDAVKEIQRQGIVVDLSHTSEATSFDALSRAEAPMVLTHAHPTKLTPTIRSKSDDLLKAVAETGGVVGVTALSMFVRLNDSEVRPTVDDLITHIDYLVDLLGPDHVAIGSDFDETTAPESFALLPDQEFVASWFGPFGLEGWLVDGYSEAAQMPNVTLGLLARGYDEETIVKILGGNFMRVFQNVWR